MSPFRHWLHDLGVARVDWAVNYYADQTNRHDARYFDTNGQEMQLELPIHFIDEYIRTAKDQDDYGAYSWNILENDLLEVGGCKAFRIDSMDDQANYEVFWSESIEQIRAAQRWKPEDGLMMLEALLNHPDPFVRVALSTNTFLPLEYKHILDGDLDEIFSLRDFKHGSSKNINLEEASVSDLKHLASSRLATERYAVAKHPKTPSHVLDQLSADVAWQVRLAVATHPNTAVEVALQIFKALAGQQSDWLRAQLASHPDCPIQLLERLAKDPRAFVQLKVLGHHNCTLKCLEYVLTNPSRDSKWRGDLEYMILEHPLVNQELLHFLQQSQNPQIQTSAIRVEQERFGTVFNQKISTKTVQALAYARKTSLSKAALKAHLANLEKITSKESDKTEINTLVEQASEVLNAYASSEHVDTERFDELLYHMVSRVVGRLQQNPKLDSKMQNMMASRLILLAENSYLQNRNDLQTETIEMLLNAKAPSLSSLSKNPSIPPETLERLCQIGWAKDVIQNPNAPLHLLEQFDTHGSFLIKHPQASSQQLERFVGRIVFERQLATHPNCPKNLIQECQALCQEAASTNDQNKLETYRQHQWEAVRFAVAKNPNITPEMLTKMFEDTSWEIRNAARKRLNPNETSFERDYRTAQTVPLNPSLSPAELVALAQTTEPWLRMIKPIIEHPNCDDMVLKTLLYRKDNYHVIQVLLHLPKTTTPMLEYMAAQPFVMADAELMQKLLIHPNTPKRVVEKFITDDRSSIQQVAQQKLQSQ